MSSRAQRDCFEDILVVNYKSLDALLLAADRAQAPSIQLEKFLGVIFRLGRGTRAREAHAARGRAPVAGSHGDKLHQIKCDVFIAAGVSRPCGWNFFHDSFSSSGNDGDVVVFVFKILQFAGDCTHNDDPMTPSAMIAEESTLVQASEAFGPPRIPAAFHPLAILLLRLSSSYRS